MTEMLQAHFRSMFPLQLEPTKKILDNTHMRRFDYQLAGALKSTAKARNPSIDFVPSNSPYLVINSLFFSRNTI